MVCGGLLVSVETLVLPCEYNVVSKAQERYCTSLK